MPIRTEGSRAYKHALVTGGAGFIGAHLAERLRAAGVRVTAVDDLRVAPLRRADQSQLLRLRVSDLTRADLDGVDLVYHLASEKSVPQSFAKPASYLENVDATIQLLNLCSDSSVRRVVVASSCEVYGVAETLPTAETAPLLPRSPYACSKVAMEMLSRMQQAAPSDPDVTVARFFNVYGPGERTDALIPGMCHAALTGRPLSIEGSGDQRRDFTYVTDLAESLVALATIPSVPVVNLGSGVSWSVREVAEIVSSLHPTASVVQAPARTNEIPEFRADLTVMRSVLGGERSSMPFEVGVARTYAWWKERLRRESGASEWRGVDSDLSHADA